MKIDWNKDSNNNTNMKMNQEQKNCSREGRNDMSVILSAHPQTDWATLPVGEYESTEAALAAIASNAICSRDCHGNDPGLWITPADKPTDRGYDRVYGRPVDVSAWPKVRLA